jgi:hypothetical protein
MPNKSAPEGVHMRATMFNVLTGFALAATIGVSPLWGQVEQTTRVVGTVERIDGANLVIKTTQSEKVVNVSADAPVFALIKATLSDVKPGTFIGVGATPQSDDSQRAIRVVIFPESMRGLGEGHRPWDRPNTTMTNATVDTTVTSIEGQLLTVRYKGGEKKILIGPDAAILTYVAAERSEIKPGASVAVNGVVKAGGAVEARRIVVGRGGVIPS